MAAPNIVDVTSIFGKTIGAAVGTSLAVVLNNAASSNKVLKVNTILLSNVDGTNDCTVRVSFNDGGSARYLAYDVDLPAKTSLVVVSKDQQIYLEENDSISASASAASDAQIIISYEELDDA